MARSWAESGPTPRRCVLIFNGSGRRAWASTGLPVSLALAPRWFNVSLRKRKVRRSPQRAPDRLHHASRLLLLLVQLTECADNLRLPPLGDSAVAHQGGHHLLVAEVLRPRLELFWRGAEPLSEA